MGKKLSIVLVLLMLVTFMLGGTASAGPVAQEATEEATSEAPLLKVAMILPGPINDNDWNMVGYNGLQAAAEELNIEVAYVENVTDADAERVLRDFATRGYDLIFAHSFSFGDAALSVAEDFPETYFMAGTARELADNLSTYSNPDYQGAYLAGMLAAGISESGVIGWVGGMPAPNMLANLHAYEAGAAEVNADIDVLFTFIGSWFDPPKAKEAALAQVEAGADVLSAQGVGVIDAANEAEVYALGAMTDQNFLGEESVVTSVTWNLGPLVTAATEEVIAGEWESRNWSFGLVEGSIQLAPYHDLEDVVTPELQELIDAKIEAIMSGEFIVEEDTTAVE